MSFLFNSFAGRIALGSAGFYRLLVVTFLGFASGLPLALTGQSMQAWLTMSNIDVATIGFLSLVGLPYTFKFIWAPLMDRFDVPWLGRRRGWLVLTQLLLAGVLWMWAKTPPIGPTLQTFALLAVLVAFVSASQDVVIDAYRTDLLRQHERGLGASLSVLGYRLAMVLSGGVALIWVDPTQKSAWSWSQVYQLMALLMLISAVLSAFALPRLPPLTGPLPSAKAHRDLLGFAALVATVIYGYLLSEQYIPPLIQDLVGPLLQSSMMNEALQRKWLDLCVLLLGVTLTLAAATVVARVVRFETLLSGLNSYFAQPGAKAFLALIVFYKLGDAFAGSLMTPFLLKAMSFSVAEVGVVNKVMGLWLTLLGALMGGVLMVRLGLWRSLILFGVLQAVSNLGFWWLAMHGKGALPSVTVPAFDWIVVSLARDTQIDGGLLMVVAIENVTGGMGTAAFVAFLMALCQRQFTATQFALLSAFASIGRVWVSPLAGVLAESIGWPAFFLVSLPLALPALLMLLALRIPIQALDQPEKETISTPLPN